MQTKLSDKQTMWEIFLPWFNFHIAHIFFNHNQVANALSQRPRVNAITIASHKNLSMIKDKCPIDSNFKDVMSMFALEKKEEP